MNYIIDSPNYDKYYIYNNYGVKIGDVLKKNPDFSSLPEEVLSELQTMKRLTTYQETADLIRQDIAQLYFGEPGLKLPDKKFLIIAGVIAVFLFLRR